LQNIDKSRIKGKLEEAQRKAFSQLFKSIREPKKTIVVIEYDNGIILQRIKVKISQEINIPLGNIKKYFDGKKTVTLRAESTAIVADPAEYIRDVDLALEYATKAKEKVDVNEILEKVKKSKK